MQNHNTDVFNLTYDTLKQRLQKEFGANGDLVFDTYRKSRPDASAPDLYIAISTARMMGLGAITIAERKYAQHAAPVYMYIFVHETDVIIPGTQHKLGAAHATEIPYKFNNITPAKNPPPSDPQRPDIMSITGRKRRAGGAQHERDVEHLREDGAPGSEGSALLAGLHHGKAGDHGDRCAMQSCRRSIQPGADYVGETRTVSALAILPAFQHHSSFPCPG